MSYVCGGGQPGLASVGVLVVVLVSARPRSCFFGWLGRGVGGIVPGEEAHLGGASALHFRFQRRPSRILERAGSMDSNDAYCIAVNPKHSQELSWGTYIDHEGHQVLFS